MHMKSENVYNTSTDTHQTFSTIILFNCDNMYFVVSNISNVFLLQLHDTDR